MITVRVIGLDRVIAKLDPGAIDPPMRRFMGKAAEAVSDNVKPFVPVDTGYLRGSMSYRVLGSRGAEIWPQAPYGIYQDQGTSHSRMPPPAALEGWARRHGFPNGFVVARAILRKGGLKKKLFMKKGARASKGKIISLARQLAKDIVNL